MSFYEMPYTIEQAKEMIHTTVDPSIEDFKAKLAKALPDYLQSVKVDITWLNNGIDILHNKERIQQQDQWKTFHSVLNESPRKQFHYSPEISSDRMESYLFQELELGNLPFTKAYGLLGIAFRYGGIKPVTMEYSIIVDHPVSLGFVFAYQDQKNKSFSILGNYGSSEMVTQGNQLIDILRERTELSKKSVILNHLKELRTRTELKETVGGGVGGAPVIQYKHQYECARTVSMVPIGTKTIITVSSLAEIEKSLIPRIKLYQPKEKQIRHHIAILSQIFSVVKSVPPSVPTYSELPPRFLRLPRFLALELRSHEQSVQTTCKLSEQIILEKGRLLEVSERFWQGMRLLFEEKKKWLSDFDKHIMKDPVSVGKFLQPLVPIFREVVSAIEEFRVTIQPKALHELTTVPATNFERMLFLQLWTNRDLVHKGVSLTTESINSCIRILEVAIPQLLLKQIPKLPDIPFEKKLVVDRINYLVTWSIICALMNSQVSPFLSQHLHKILLFERKVGYRYMNLLVGFMGEASKWMDEVKQKARSS